jgi:dihydroflavonol-4-reductase
LAWADLKVNVVDVRDVALAHINAARYGLPGERYLLGGHNLSLRHFIEAIAEIAEVREPIFEIPLQWISFLIWLEDHIPGVNIYANHLRALQYGPFFSNEKAVSLLKLHFRPLKDTIKEALQSYRLRGYL